MIDQSKKQKLAEQKARVHRRVYAEVDPNNYAFIPAKKQIDYYDNDVPQRVAVYARVSTDNIQQTSSYELQKKYYEEFVVHHPNWTLVKIYADEGISGTSLAHRDEFNRMISDCRAGKIDMIITKSPRTVQTASYPTEHTAAPCRARDPGQEGMRSQRNSAIPGCIQTRSSQPLLQTRRARSLPATGLRRASSHIHISFFRPEPY